MKPVPLIVKVKPAAPAVAALAHVCEVPLPEQKEVLKDVIVGTAVAATAIFTVAEVIPPIAMVTGTELAAARVAGTTALT